MRDLVPARSCHTDVYCPCMVAQTRFCDMEFAKIQRGATVEGESGNSMDQLPKWMDIERFRCGQQFFKSHIAVIVLALHCSLTVGFALEGLLQALVFSRGSDTPSKAIFRYLRTFAHVTLWNTTDVWDSKEESLGRRSLEFVRRTHRRIAVAMKASALAKSSDEDKSSVQPPQQYVSQYDMSVVQSGFMGLITMYPAKFGISCSTKELANYVFFWRGIGYLLGIDDQYNLCSGGLEQAISLVKHIEIDLVVRGLESPPADFCPMAEAYIDGQNRLCGMHLNTKESVVAFFLDVAGHQHPAWLHLTTLDHLRLFAMKAMIFMVRWCPGFEQLLNLVIRRLFDRSLPLVIKQLHINPSN